MARLSMRTVTAERRESGTASKTLVDLHQCDDVVGQQWKVIVQEYITNPHSGLCLDDQYANTSMEQCGCIPVMD